MTWVCHKNYRWSQFEMIHCRKPFLFSFLDCSYNLTILPPNQEGCTKIHLFFWVTTINHEEGCDVLNKQIPPISWGLECWFGGFDSQVRGATEKTDRVSASCRTHNYPHVYEVYIRRIRNAYLSFLYQMAEKNMDRWKYRYIWSKKNISTSRSDLGPQKLAEVQGNPRIFSEKSRLVKYH